MQDIETSVDEFQKCQLHLLVFISESMLIRFSVICVHFKLHFKAENKCFLLAFLTWNVYSAPSGPNPIEYIPQMAKAAHYNTYTMGSITHSGLQHTQWVASSNRGE